MLQVMSKTVLHQRHTRTVRTQYELSKVCAQAFVGYRDIEDPLQGLERFRILGFVCDPKTFHDFLSGVRPAGGGCTCEDIAGGLQVQLTCARTC